MYWPQINKEHRNKVVTKSSKHPPQRKPPHKPAQTHHTQHHLYTLRQTQTHTNHPQHAPHCLHTQACSQPRRDPAKSSHTDTPAPGPQPQSPGLPFLAGEGGEGLGRLGAGSALVPSLCRLARSFLSGRVSQPSPSSGSPGCSGQTLSAGWSRLMP